MTGLSGRAVLILTALLVGGVILPEEGRPASAGSPEKGKARYEQYCAMCHGSRGLGDGPMAKATTPPAPKLITPEIRAQSDQALLQLIRDGKGTAMPPWGGILSDQELVDLVAYLRTLGG